MNAGAGPDQSASAERHLAAMAELCETAMPGYALRLHLLNAPHRVAPWVIFGEEAAAARMVAESGGEILASRRVGARAPGAPFADVFAMPAPHWDLSGRPSADHETTLQGRKARLLFQISPLGFELAKYAAERFWQMRGGLAGRWPMPAEVSAWPRLGPEGYPDPSSPTTESAAGAAPNPRPAIVIALHWLEHGGAEALAFDTIGWALDAGLRVFVIAEKDAPHRLAARLPQSPDLKFLRTDRFLPQRLLGAYLVNLARAENLRLLHIHHCLPAYLALPQLKAAFPGLRVIDSTHIIEHRDGGFAAMAGDWSAFVDTHHVISNQLGEMLRTRYGVADGKIRLGRLLERAEVGPQAPEFTLDPSSGRLRIAFVGRMTHQKRPIILARIMRSLARWASRAGVDLRFEIVGEGPYLRTFHDLLRRFRLESRTSLHPADSDVPAVMARADILLLPSANEGLALVCFEALTHGTLAITTDVGAQSELIAPDLLVHPSPLGIGRRVCATIDRLWRDAAFHARVVDAQKSRMRALAADPTAREALMPVYTAAAMEVDR